MNSKFLISLGVISFWVSGFTACQQIKKPDSPVVARVNNEDITVADMEAVFQSEVPQIQIRYKQVEGPRILLQNMIDQIVLEQEVKRRGFFKQDAVRWIEMRSRLDAFASQPGMVEVTPEEIKHVYSTSPAFRATMEYHYRRILFHSHEDAKKAKGLLKKTRFEDLVQKLSIDQVSAVDGGLMPAVRGSHLPAAIESALKNMKIGEVSSPLPIDQGWQIIRKEGQVHIKQPAFELVRENIRRRIAIEKVQKELMRWRQQANVKIDDRMLYSISFAERTNTPAPPLPQ